MTIIEILRLLIPFKTHDTTASHLRRQLEDVDLEAMIAEQRTKDVVREIKPAVETTNPMDKEYFHALNAEGKRCFDAHIRQERVQGIVNPDQGSPPFTARRSMGRCLECGESILEGDLMIIRQPMKKTG
jgi:hypothetical protein